MPLEFSYPGKCQFWDLPTGDYSTTEKDPFMKAPEEPWRDPLLPLGDVLSRLRISKSNWYAGMSRGEYPRPLRIGTRTVRWRQSDIDGYLGGKNAGLGKPQAM